MLEQFRFLPDSVIGQIPDRQYLLGNSRNIVIPVALPLITYSIIVEIIYIKIAGLVLFRTAFSFGSPAGAGFLFDDKRK